MPQLPGGGGTSDDMITVGLSIAQAINETRAALVAVAARTAPGSYSGSEVAAGAASVTVPISLTADLVEIDLSTSPVTAGADLWARFVQSVPLVGATDYTWTNLRGATLTNNLADAKFQVATNLQAGTLGSLRFRLVRPNSLNLRKTIAWDGFIMENGTNAPVPISGGGRFMLNTTIPIDAVQFLFSAGAMNPTYTGTKYTAFGT